MLKGTFGGGFQVFQFPIRLFLQSAFGSFQCSGSLSIRIVIISRGTFLGRVVLTSGFFDISLYQRKRCCIKGAVSCGF